MPRVSIILPCYNEEEAIQSAIMEIDKQTFKDREIIIVDDGSNDRTAEVVAKYCLSHQDARLIEAKHGGPSHVRNVGIKESLGDIIFFAETDCVYDSDYVEKGVNCLDSHPESNAVCLTGGPLKTRSTLATECIEIENVVQHTLLAQGKIKPFYAWVFRKKPFIEIGGFDEKLFQGEDKDVFRRFVNAGNKVAWLPGIHWRHRRDQTTAQLAQKWFLRGRSRVLYVLKHRLALDMAKKLIPFWSLVFGMILLFTTLALLGWALILLVLAIFIGKSLRTAVFVWSSLSNRKYLLGYPVFLMARNFSSALGYTYGIISPIHLSSSSDEVELTYNVKEDIELAE